MLSMTDIWTWIWQGNSTMTMLQFQIIAFVTSSILALITRPNCYRRSAYKLTFDMNPSEWSSIVIHFSLISSFILLETWKCFWKTRFSHSHLVSSFFITLCVLGENTSCPSPGAAAFSFFFFKTFAQFMEPAYIFLQTSAFNTPLPRHIKSYIIVHSFRVMDSHQALYSS